MNIRLGNDSHTKSGIGENLSDYGNADKRTVDVSVAGDQNNIELVGRNILFFDRSDTIAQICLKYID